MRMRVPVMKLAASLFQRNGSALVSPFGAVAKAAYRGTPGFLPTRERKKLAKGEKGVT